MYDGGLMSILIYICTCYINKHLIECTYTTIIQRRNIIKTILTPKQQIEDLKLKGVTFKYTHNEAQALSYLTDNTYYYKLKSYARNFEQYRLPERSHEYLHLDFSYLVALSNCDFYLRSFILQLTINIEHYLKVFLNNSISNNSDFDNDQFLSNFFNQYRYIYNNLNNKPSNTPYITSLAKNTSSYKYWHLFELLTFGNIVNFYRLYIAKYNIPNNKALQQLHNIKQLRNSAAHNNCLLNSLTSDISFSKFHNIGILTKDIGGLRNNATKVCFVHDICILLNFADKYITSKDIKSKYKDELKDIIPKICELKNMVSSTENLYIILNDIICVLEHYSNT